jgi:hypothetical protein
MKPKILTPEEEKALEARRASADCAPAPGSEIERELMQLRAIQPGQIRNLLVKTGIIPQAAIEDPEGYDNHETWDAVNRVALELKGTLFPNEKLTGGADGR